MLPINSLRGSHFIEGAQVKKTDFNFQDIPPLKKKKKKTIYLPK